MIRQVGLVALAFWLGVAGSGQALANTENISSGCNAFAFSMQKELVRTHSRQNIFFSPYSLSAALGMTWAGARGETAAQMAGALHLDQSREKALANYTELNRIIGETRGVQLDAANALWAQQGFPFLSSFRKETASVFRGEFNPLDLAGAPEQSRMRINKWVEKKTCGKISELLAKGSIDPQTRLVLTNAVYFKGDWEVPFKGTDTLEGLFTREDGTTTKVPMMHRTGEYRYTEDESCRMVLIPYMGQDVVMAVLLPKGTLDELCSRLDADVFKTLFDQASPAEISLALPRFNVEASYDMRDVLEALGMQNAFNVVKADFSGIDGRRDLFVSQVAHKAVLEVNESGSEAAAATGVIVAMRMMPHVIPFAADRPFMVAIVHAPSQAILFLGAVHDLP